MSSRRAQHGRRVSGWGLVLVFSDHVCSHLQHFHRVFTFTVDFINDLTNFKGQISSDSLS